MHADPLSLVGGKTLDQQAVQIDETLQKSPRRVQLHRKPPFREIDLDRVSASLEAASNMDWKAETETVFLRDVDMVLIGE